MKCLPFLSSSPILAACLLPAVLLTACVLPRLETSKDARAMAKLLVARLEWMDDVAMVKQIRSLPITDAPREAELLNAMEQRGVAAGIPATAVRAFFAGQITAAKRCQEEWLQEHPKGTLEYVMLPDLGKTVRPALDEISGEMIERLAGLRASGAETAGVLNEARGRLQRAGYSEAVIRAALEGLAGGLNG